MNTDHEFKSRQVDVPALERLGRSFEAAFEPKPRNAGVGWAVRLAVAVALAALVGLTPTGRAVASDVAALIGIDNLLIEDGSFSGDLGQGTLAGQPYSVTVSGDGEPGETCIFVAFDRAPGSDMGSCQGEGSEKLLDENTVYPFVYRPAEGVADTGAMVQTLTTRDVERIEVEFTRMDGSRGSETLDRFVLSPEAVERVGLPPSESVAFFVGLLPDTLPPDLSDPAYDASEANLIKSMELVSFDGDGNKIARSKLTEAADYPDSGNYDSRLKKRRFGQVLPR